MQRHSTSHLENKQNNYLVGIRWLGGMGLHTTRSFAQIFVGVVFNVSSHLYDFCCGYFFMSAVKLRGCGVGSLCGCCKWCLLLLAGWCGGFSGVQESEAYAVLVLFSACWVGEV